jgi:D-xylose transport system substrate-binding protein
MKNKFTMLFIGLLILTSVVALQSFRTAQAPQFGFLLANLDNDRWYKDRDFFIDKIQSLGGEVIVENAHDDADEQIVKAKELISKGIKVLTIISVDGNSAAAIVDLAHKAGVKVIAYDRLIKNCDLDYYVSFNSVKVGEMMANYAISQKPNGNYCIINGPEVDNNSKLIRQGVMNILQKQIDDKAIKVILNHTLTRWNDMETMLMLEEFYASGKETCDAIISPSDIVSAGCVNYLESNNLSGKVLITGQNADLDACKWILTGKQAMTIYKPMKKLAYQAAEIAMKLAKGETISSTATIENGKISVPAILIEPIFIDKSNVKDVLTGDAIWTDEQLNEK